MALAVDAAGRVAANPKTGKILGDNGGKAAKGNASNGANNKDNELQQTEKQESTRVRNRNYDIPELSTPLSSGRDESRNIVDQNERESDTGSFWDNYFEDQRNKDLETAKELDDMFSDGTANSVLSPTMTSRNTSIDQGTEYTPGEGKTNRLGEEYASDPKRMTVNDMYEDLFLKDGMDPESVDLMHSGARILDNDTQLVSDTVDDGTMDYEHLTSPMVKGSQLQHYARSGLVPGMTAAQIEQIGPDYIYDKTQLAKDFGYQPYVPDTRTMVDNTADSLVNFVTDAAGEVGNLRNSVASAINPYTISYDDGQGNSFDNINGPMFDKNLYGYYTNVYNDSFLSGNNRFFEEPDKDLDVTWYNDVTRTEDPEGNVHYHFGSHPIENPEDWDDYYDEATGTYTVPFSDGTEAVMTEDYAYNHPLDDHPSYWLPNYVMDDGTSLPYGSVLDIINGRYDNDYDNDEGIRYNFSSLLPMIPENPVLFSNRPSYLQEQPINVDENGNLDFSNIVSNASDRVLDWTLGSAPIMIEQTQWPASLANAMRETRGLSSSSYDPVTNSYSRYRVPGDNVIDDVVPVLTAGAVPVTENMVGPVGSAGSWVPSVIANRLERTPGLWGTAGRFLRGINSEGWEEIAGNLFEELGDYGLSRAFGNYLDENGNVVPTEDMAAKDEFGRPLKQENSPILDRLYNFGIPMPNRGGAGGLFQPDALANNANAWIGGAAISALPTAIEESANSAEIADNIARLNALGVTPYKEPRKMRYRVAPERYLEQFGNEE